MKLYPEMFISKWHLIALGMIVIAWIALWLGGYDRRMILKSGLGATLVLYIVATIPIAIITHDHISVKERMNAELDRHYAIRLEAGGELSDIDKLAAVAVPFRDDDDYATYIYAGNYSESFSFNGMLKMVIYDEQGKLLHEETYEKVVLKPGERKKVDKFYSEGYAKGYQYKFTYHPPAEGS